MRQTLVRLLHEDLTDCLPKIQASVLLIWGDLDTATPLADAKVMEKAIPDAGLVVLEGAGHFFLCGKVGQCSRVLDAFCPAEELRKAAPPLKRSGSLFRRVLASR